MPKTITVTLSHDLGVQEARRRIDEGFDKIKGSMSAGTMLKFERSWVNDEKLTFSGKGLGQSAHGEIDIFPAHVRITATLPTILASIAEAITGKMEAEGRLLLEKK